MYDIDGQDAPEEVKFYIFAIILWFASFIFHQFFYMVKQDITMTVIHEGDEEDDDNAAVHEFDGYGLMIFI